MNTEQLDMWEGDFGNTYTKRNPVDWVTRVRAFSIVVGDLKLGSILEVGCNRGHNLIALSKVVPETCQIIGVEPNAFALDISKSYKVKTVKGNIFNLPFQTGQFDMVMTAAVLSHIHMDNLEQALLEIYRVSNRYILAMEYYWHMEKEISYTGKGLWRRPYHAAYLYCFPDLKIIKDGSLGYKDGFDKLSFWVFEK